MLPFSETELLSTALLRDTRRGSWIISYPVATFIERTVNETSVPLCAVVERMVVTEQPGRSRVAQFCIDAAMCGIVLAELLATFFLFFSVE